MTKEDIEKRYNQLVNSIEKKGNVRWTWNSR